MKSISLTASLLLGALALFAATPKSAAQTPVLNIEGSAAGAKLVPIAIKGFSGEADRVVRFDLEAIGFKIVPEEESVWVLSGKSDGAQVEGQLYDRVRKAYPFAKNYVGGSTRTQAHTLADDVVAAIHGLPGIFNTKIAFRASSGRNHEINLSDFDGFDARQVTTEGKLVAAPVWIPKKWGMLYTTYRTGYPHIYAHDLGTGQRQVVARYPGLNSSAAVSPDGKQVAMILSKNGNPDVYVSDMDGSNLIRLTNTPEDESSPCWSPDGRTICFAGRPGERRSLAVVPSSGGKVVRLRTSGILNPSEPEWSPDGKWIAFTSQMGGFQICRVAAEGGDAEVLVEGEDPTWAPNSRTILFSQRKGGKRVLSLLDVPTKRVKDTLQVSGSRDQPTWAK